MTGSDYSEATLIEAPAIALFEQLSWEHANCFHEFDHGRSPLGRETKAEVVLLSRLRPALENLNPELPAEAYEQAIDELTRHRSAMSMAAANREIYKLLKDGVKVTIRGEDGEGQVEILRVIDWTEPENNNFFLASQFWVSGELYTRRADLVGFVNGLPIVFIELKAAHRRLQNAYDHNLRDYKDTIPHLFWYNGLVILSNGSLSRLGSVTAEWEHFAEWKKINSEGEEGVVSLETMIRGTCERTRLLDLVENFTLFQEVRGGLIKVIAKNHQYLGVSNALEAVRKIGELRGRLGVFWHTQGSGKSIAMIFFSQKILRKIPGNWTFVVVTDRTNLDDQIYKTFTSSGVVTETEVQAQSAADLRQLLREDHRYVFTLIHKFRTDREEQVHPVLSTRPDIVVIADEAHRTQYDTLARNMRSAMPNAAFIAFTGTPLMAGEQKTRQVFGDYVSIYNFKQSCDDRNTVPLHYENRIPELQLTNEDLNADIYRVVEEAELDDEQEKKLEREFARQYHLITREDRLEKVAEDIVAHFMGRGFRGKGMVVSIDKATAVLMYDKVQKYWKNYLEGLRHELESAPMEQREKIEPKIRYMEETDMAVVVSPSQNEIAGMRNKGLDITPHRRRMVNEDLDTKFQNEGDPFRLVFVCAMWMTGFDVPSCSTIYLDKPMRNHTLMQAIARANRVFQDKRSGLIVDYVGVFREVEKALAVYGSASGGGVKPGESPVQDKSVLVEQLKQAMAEATAFCVSHGVDLGAIEAAKAFERVRQLDHAVDAILVNDESKHTYLALADTVSKLYKAILPDPAANELAPVCTLLSILAQKIRSLAPPVDISDVMGAVEEVLDESIAAEGYVIRSSEEAITDLSKIDFDRLRKKFEEGHKRIEAEKLRASVSRKLRDLVPRNRTRMDYLQKFQQMIAEYNAGSLNTEVFFDRLVQLARELNEEEQRHITEQLTEEELAIYDLVTKPDIKLNAEEQRQVKIVARELLANLKQEKLVIDWRKRQQSRAGVRLAIEQALERLPPGYTGPNYQQKCEAVYQHVFDSYWGQDLSVYTPWV